MKFKFLFLMFVFVSLLFQTAISQDGNLKGIYAKKMLAVKRLDIDELSKYVTSNVIAEVKNATNPKEIMILMREYSPIEYTLGNVIFNSDDTATMEIKGKTKKLVIDLAGNEKKGATANFNGVIRFKKEDGSWKIFKEDFKFEH